MGEVDKALARLEATISGRVQGVAYRWHALREAERLGLVGWVRNLSNGSVGMVAEGPRDTLEILLSWCHEGPSHADVKDIDVYWTTATSEFSSFEIRH